MVVGNIGAPGRINYTIVGDTVNTCQRLEALGRNFDRGEAATILVSGTVAAAGRRPVSRPNLTLLARGNPSRGICESIDALTVMERA